MQRRKNMFDIWELLPVGFILSDMEREDREKEAKKEAEQEEITEEKVLIFSDMIKDKDIPEVKKIILELFLKELQKKPNDYPYISFLRHKYHELGVEKKESQNG